VLAHTHLRSKKSNTFLSFAIYSYTESMTPHQIKYLQLVTNLQPLLLGYIHSIAPGVEADDVLQETNIVLWNKMETFEMGTNFKAFAFKIAYLKTMECLRKQARNQWLVFDSDLLEKMNTHFTDHPNTMGDTQFALRLCMKKLKDHERELIHQRYSKGNTVRSIAKQVEKKEGALQQAFFRIHNALRTCISHQLQEEHPAI